MKRLLIILLLVSALFTSTRSQTPRTDPPFLKYLDHPWVDSVMSTMTQREKIGQLIWIAGFSNRDISYDTQISNTVEKLGLGGIIFFQGNPVKQAEMINHFRKISKIAPLIAIDGEWGLGMRLEGVGSFPFQMTLGAISDDSLIYSMGTVVGKQLKRAGVNINLAPVADVNNNMKNPVINYRSFGENPQDVAVKAMAYMKGMQGAGIFSVAKHFPGHGDTEVDSHIDLPVLPYTRERLDSLELRPFAALIDAGVSGVMPGHLWIKALEDKTNTPSTLSENVITGLLKKELKFSGLVLSDAMNMGGVTNYAPLDKAEVIALKAGIDVLEYVTDPAGAVIAIEKALSENLISQAEIELKCRKILAAKYWAGLNKPVPVSTDKLPENLFGPGEKALNTLLYESAITLLRNENNLVPLMRLDTLKIATITIDNNSVSRFEERVGSYTRCTNFVLDSFSEKDISNLLKSLSGFNLVIAGIHGTGYRSSQLPVNADSISMLLDTISKSHKLITAFFGNPYSLGKMSMLHNADGLLLCYQDNDFAGNAAAQIIFGGSGARGRLPVTISESFRKGDGYITKGELRMKFGLPENSGIDSDLLNYTVDSIAMSGILKGAYPGCEIMIARKGRVIFHKTYGFQTYENRITVNGDDLFDLASVTKISSSMAGLLLLDSKGLFTPDKTLAGYLPYYKRSDKGSMVLREMLAHQAGLTAWIPFWRETVDKGGGFKRGIFSKSESAKYPVKVADELYINRKYRSKIFSEIRKSPVREEKKYLYSDLTFIIVPDIIEKLSGKKFEDFLKEEVYHKIGAFDICFNPWKNYPPVRIVPTEYDSLFRKQLLHRTVHDEGAAMLGGISGHAGLFATATDLMKLMELYRRMGSYGGEQIFDPEVMKEYTSYQFPENNNRRGVGFDKPLVNNATAKPAESYPCPGASPSSFGHSGYTGTFVWIDPEKEVTYVFLCNRVYPTRNNSLLSDLNIRTNILQAIYDSISGN